jgi:hypothetical protein
MDRLLGSNHLYWFFTAASMRLFDDSFVTASAFFDGEEGVGGIVFIFIYQAVEKIRL